MIRTEQEGDRLSHDELRNLVLNILVGGVDTSQLAHTVGLLAEHPDQWKLLRADLGAWRRPRSRRRPYSSR